MWLRLHADSLGSDVWEAQTLVCTAAETYTEAHSRLYEGIYNIVYTNTKQVSASEPRATATHGARLHGHPACTAIGSDEASKTTGGFIRVYQQQQ